MAKYIMALDSGTTSNRCILFNEKGEICSVSQREFTQYYPKPGWVEHDANEIWETQLLVCRRAMEKIGAKAEDIAALGITNQRETTIVWDKQTGEPVCNAIVWQCRRTAEICEQLAREGCGDMIAEKTGLRLDAYFSAGKIKWILDHVDGARARAERGELLFGTVDTWLLWKLTDGRVHVTDRTNACRTMLYNINTCRWDEELCRLFDIPMSMLPEVRSSSEIYGEMNLMGARVPLCGIAGDQQAALYGQGCLNEGDMKITYGTGCFLLANTGHKPVFSRHGLLTTVAATGRDMPVQYALEGSVFVGGAVIQWLRDELRFIKDSADSEYFARKVKDSGGVYIVPAFAGLGAPHWDMRARGVITGLTRGVGAEHIIRAALESIAYQSEDVIQAMRSDMHSEIGSLKVDGGASANNLLMQFQADISNLQVLRPAQKEATAAGAALLAGQAVGFYRSLSPNDTPCTVFKPMLAAGERERLLKGWRRAVQSCLSSEESDI